MNPSEIVQEAWSPARNILKVSFFACFGAAAFFAWIHSSMAGIVICCICACISAVFTQNCLNLISGQEKIVKDKVHLPYDFVLHSVGLLEDNRDILPDVNHPENDEQTNLLVLCYRRVQYAYSSVSVVNTVLLLLEIVTGILALFLSSSWLAWIAWAIIALILMVGMSYLVHLYRNVIKAHFFPPMDGPQSLQDVYDGKYEDPAQD